MNGLGFDHKKIRELAEARNPQVNPYAEPEQPADGLFHTLDGRAIRMPVSDEPAPDNFGNLLAQLMRG